MQQPSLDALDALYAGPTQIDEKAKALADVRRLRQRGGILLAISMGGCVLGAVVAAVAGPFGAVVCLGVTLVALVGAGYSFVAFTKATAAGTAGAATSLLLGLGNLAMSGVGLVGAMVSTMAFTRGRQIRRFGKILLPPVVEGGAWASSEIAIDDTISPSLRRELAAQWRENGRTEHASVAAFARLTLDLMALGAPPSLVADAQRDALDEIRHAELCFGLAKALDGLERGPGAFPAAAKARTLPQNRSLALAQLAVDSLIDGALHEGVSARIVARLRKRAVSPAIRSVLDEIARDEGRHARHGWDVLRWCVAEGGDAVRSALEGALRGLPREMISPMSEAAVDGAWERFGLMGRAIEHEEHALALADLEHRLRPMFRAAAYSGARLD